MSIRNVIGSLARGDNFFDRKDERKKLWVRLGTDSVLLLAPRRVGKSSLLQQMRDEAADRDAHVAYLSVSHQTREIDLIRALFGALPEGKVVKALKRMQRFLPQLKKVDAGFFTAEFADAHEAQWKSIADALLQTLRDERGGGSS